MRPYQGKTLQEWAGSSKILALVFTDIVGSTGLGVILGDKQYLEIVRKHIAQGRFLIQKHNGYEIKVIGDSFMVVFYSAVEALNFALDFRNNPGTGQILIRAGIHVGPVHIFENDLIGLAVNYTKRVESAAGDWGGIVLSDEAKTHIDNEKDARHVNLGYVPSTVSLKGFNTPKTLWRVY